MILLEKILDNTLAAVFVQIFLWYIIALSCERLTAGLNLLLPYTIQIANIGCDTWHIV